MPPIRRLPGLLLLALALGAGACSIRGLDEPQAALSQEEQGRVADQVNRALEEERWIQAWNQAVDGGLDRSRLEAIALAALAARDSSAEGMLEELTVKYGGLSEEGLAQAALVGKDLSERGEWKWAARALVYTADDAPAYRKAWALYDRAPPRKAPKVLEVILQAREDAEEKGE